MGSVLPSPHWMVAGLWTKEVDFIPPQDEPRQTLSDWMQSTPEEHELPEHGGEPGVRLLQSLLCRHHHSILPKRR